MADENAPPEGAKDDKPKEQEGQKPPEKKPDPVDPDIEAIASQAENPDAVRNALVAERKKAADALKTAQQAQQEVQQFRDRDLTEQQKLEKKAKDAETRAESAEANLLRFQVATEKQLPAELAVRLVGKNQSELEQDADRLLALVRPQAPEGDGDGGKGDSAGSGAGGDFNEQIRQQYAGR